MSVRESASSGMGAQGHVILDSSLAITGAGVSLTMGYQPIRGAVGGQCKLTHSDSETAAWCDLGFAALRLNTIGNSPAVVYGRSGVD